MILDYIWKSLFLGSLSATVYLAIMILASVLLKRASPSQLKWYFNSQLLILTAILLGGFYVASVDHQLLTGCFETFVKQSASWTVTRWIAGVWVGGFTFLLGCDALRGYLVIRKTRGLARVDDPKTLALFQRLKAAVGVSRRVELLAIDENLSPFAFGFFRHQVIVPNVGLSEATLTSALAHELIHVREFDSLGLSLELFCRRILFWHPLVHIFSGIYLLCVEKAADEGAVLRASIGKQNFLSALLEMAALSARGPASPLRVNASRGYRECKARIECLMKAPSAKRFRSLPAFALIVLTPVAVSIAQAGTVRRAVPFDPKMCMQVDHEKIIESWLKIEPAPPLKCGK